MAFGFYLDPAGTTPIVSPPQFVQAVSSPVAADKVIYFGTPGAGHWLAAVGGGNIVASLSGPGAANIALALSAAGLASATPGAALSLGAQVEGLIPLHVRALDTTHVAGNRAFTVTTNTVEEWAP